MNSWFIVIMPPMNQGNADEAYKRKYTFQLTFLCLLFLQNGKLHNVKVSPSKYSFLAIVSHLILINLKKGNINYQQIIPFDIFRLMRNFRNVFLHVCQRILLSFYTMSPYFYIDNTISLKNKNWIQWYDWILKIFVFFMNILCE